jgi:hypothetical protein
MCSPDGSDSSVSTICPDHDELRCNVAVQLAARRAAPPGAPRVETAGSARTGAVETDPARKPVWERILERSAAIPAEEWDKLPTDLSEQHDHYIYGTPKRTTP